MQQELMATVAQDRHVEFFTSRRTDAEVDVAALVPIHSAVMYRVALSVLHRPAEAEDVVQEAFLRALTHQRTLAEVDEVRAWLVRVVWNLALDRKRRVTPEQIEETALLMIASAELPADRRVAAAAELAKVLGVMEGLPKTERAVLVLHALEELSSAEIAQVLGRSEASVRSLLFRARAHLRERLDPGMGARERDRKVWP